MLYEQIEWLRAIQQIRSPGLDKFFYFVNYLDSIYFILFLIPFVWVGFSHRWGMRLYYLAIASALANSFFKHLFHLPRPCVLDPDICMVQLSSYSFPSGGAQTAMLFGGIFFLFCPSKWGKAFGILFFLIMSFSRLYLGVHFPIDIVGGWLIGATILLFFVAYKSQIDRFFEKRSAEKGLLHSIWIPIVAGAPSFYWNFKVIPILIGSVAIALGIYISRKKHLFLSPPRSIYSGILRGLFAVFGAFLLYIPALLTRSIFVKEEIVPLIVGFWIAAGASLIISSTKISKSE